jgi:hypothetical protein
MSTALLDPHDPLRIDARTGLDERAARRALMDQLARLDAELGAITLARPAPVRGGRIGRATPRLLSLAELEAERDRMTARIGVAQRAAGDRARREEQSRRLREELLLDPAAHPWVRVSNAAVGEPGCRDWHVRPRFGLLGVLMRWWRVVVSSGCP